MFAHRRSTSHRQRKSERRTGAVAVEFAMVVPIVFLFFFAAFEFCRVAMIRHTADNAVYEAARRGIVPGARSVEVRREAERILSTIGLVDYDIRVSPARITDETTEVTVEVSVPVDANSFVPGGYFTGQAITRELTMSRE